MGETHVKLKSTKLDTYYGYFYEQKQGNDIFDLHYFTSGPDRMKYIRLVQMKNKIGMFSRPAYTEQIKAKYAIVLVYLEMMKKRLNIIIQAKKFLLKIKI